MVILEKTVVEVRKVVYKTTSKASTSASPPKAMKRKVPPVNASASIKRKACVATAEKSSEEVSPLSHKTALNSKKGKAINKGKKPISTPLRVTRMSGVNLRIEPPVPPAKPLVSPVDVETPVPTPTQSPEHTKPTPEHDSNLKEIPQRPVSPINIDSDTDSSERTVFGFEQQVEENDNLPLEEYPLNTQEIIQEIIEMFQVKMVVVSYPTTIVPPEKVDSHVAH